MGTSKTSEDAALFADLKRDPRKTGILPSQEIRELIQNRKILPNIPIDDAQIPPASMDLRLGNIAYRVQASFLPGRASAIVRAPYTTASIPEAQTLFTVSAVVVLARPALKAAWRAGAWPAPA